MHNCWHLSNLTFSMGNPIALKISSIDVCIFATWFVCGLVWIWQTRLHTLLWYITRRHYRHFCQRLWFLYILLLFSSRHFEGVFCVSNTSYWPIRWISKSKLEICFLIIHLFNFCAKFQNPNIQRGWKLFSVWAPQSTIAQIQVLRRTDESTKDYLSTRIATSENIYRSEDTWEDMVTLAITNGKFMIDTISL